MGPEPLRSLSMSAGCTVSLKPSVSGRFRPGRLMSMSEVGCTDTRAPLHAHGGSGLRSRSVFNLKRVHRGLPALSLGCCTQPRTGTQDRSPRSA
jgi:hypothetical protein